MVYRCCVPNCPASRPKTEGSDAENNNVSMHAFPKHEELFKKWMAAIPREN